MAPHKSSKNKSAKKKKVEVSKKIPYYRKPENLTLDQWQIGLRKQFGQDNEFLISNIGQEKFFSDFYVTNNATNNSYKVAIRSADDSQNFCECLDFKTNRLGVCKHISATMQYLSKIHGSKKAFKDGFQPHYSSVYLDYRNGREIKIRVGLEQKEAYLALAKTYFDQNFVLKPASFGVFELFLEEANKLSNSFRCYPDALDFVIAERDKTRRRDYLWRIMPDGDEDKAFDGLLKVPLFPYQRKGVFFAALAGRSLITDEMGLGKTLQGIATAELYRKELGINRVLIVCPTSLKYQWKSEIEKFTDSVVHVVEGPLLKRKAQYEFSEAFYVIVSYHAVTNDLDLLNKMEADMVILDEAQRIKNWKTKVSQQIKKLVTPYAIVLTGTPLENKLEELYSISQFIDVYRLGPIYRFLNQYQITDDAGKVVGYKNLREISEKLSDILIRRTKKEVLSQLPKRMDKNLFVPMTQEQMDMHNDLGDNVAKLVNKWRRYGFLNETDRKRLILSLSQMRMVCNSTYILDQKTRHDTKIEEVMNILDEVFEHSDEKVVIFSQWERMTRLVSQELNQREVKYEYLHGGVESAKRKDLLDNFKNDPKSRVFLSTDAGGVGLNLQSASLMINLDIPWNPAVLEQRIARIYRLGQERNVSIINLVSTGTIEHKMLDVLKFKGAMAEGVLDGGEDTIFLGDDKFKQFMNSVESLTDAPQDENAIIDAIEEHEVEEQELSNTSESILIDTPEAELRLGTATFMGDDDINETEEQVNFASSSGNIISPNDELIQSGVKFFTQLAQTLNNPEVKKNFVEYITEKDETGKVYLKIPVENEEVIGNTLQTLAALFGAFIKQ
ncbi:DEAD/DEAH box helicase [Emticicia sp. SJ17W-69]|uniref:DEAD/DEAH box helicase n=1 Tax=Emticicia sp. SJ17W-69 TaxID=3421657 RepID=UPI003EBB2271